MNKRRRRERWWGKTRPFKYRRRRRLGRIQPSFFDERTFRVMDAQPRLAPVVIEPQKRVPVGKRRDRRRPSKPR